MTQTNNTLFLSTFIPSGNGSDKGFTAQQIIFSMIGCLIVGLITFLIKKGCSKKKDVNDFHKPESPGIRNNMI